MTARVSVLMTVYNGERYLAQAVESVLGQTFTDLEFIVRDDGSTDGTAALLQAYAARDPRLVLHLGQPNLGIVRSMNTLFPLARGEFINRHDADDISLPDRLAQQVAFLDQHPSVGLVATDIQVIDADGQPVAAHFFARATAHAGLQAALLEDNSNLCQGSVLYRRACLEQVGLYDVTLEQAEDYDLWLRLAETSEMASLPQVLYQYRQHPAGVTKQRYFRALLDKATVLERALHRRLGEVLPAAERQRLAERYTDAMLAALAVGEVATAKSALARVLAHDPNYFAVPAPQLLRWLESQTAPRPVHENLALMSLVFDTLPATPLLARLKHHALARIYLKEVFAGARQNDADRIRRHLWQGLRHDPRWLLNRGVLSILARSLLRRYHKRSPA